MAHELAHIKNHDTLTMTIAATIGGAISMLAQYMQFGVMFGGHRDNRGGVGLIGTLVAISSPRSPPCSCRWRSAARANIRPTAWARRSAGHPLWLASALAKIQNYAHRIPNEEAEAAPATAHIFIINPLTGRGRRQLVLDAPQHREPHRRARGDGARDGPNAGNGLGRGFHRLPYRL